MTLMIAIAGGSGSGKTTLAQALCRAVPAGAATLVSEDWYYGDHGADPGFDPAAFNFDDLSARDHELLHGQLAALKAGRAVQAPTYSFVHHRRVPEGLALAPTPLVVVEGAHILCTPALAALFDLRIFVDTPPDIRFIRRLLRDQRERERTADSVVAQYLATVREAHLRWVEPCRARADIVIVDDTAAVVPEDPVEITRLLAPVLAHACLAKMLGGR